MLRRRPGLFAAVILIAATQARAQDQPDRGPRGPRGLGRPATAVVWDLLRTPEVQKELAISDEQKQPLDNLQNELQQQAAAAFGGLGQGAQDAEDREKRMVEMRAKLAEANQQAEAKLGKLLQPGQLDRLNQLRLQREGSAALVRPEVAEQLSLNDEQKAKAREAQDQRFGGFGLPQQNPQPAADLLANLTDDQKAKWAKLTGEKFEFPQSLNRPGGFGRGPGGFGGPGGPGGFGGQELALVEKFDKDGNGWLNADERKSARASLPALRGVDGGRGGRGFGPGGPGGPRGPRRSEPGKPGPHVAVADVTPQPDAPLYAPNVLRTLFVEFENSEWETELADFHNTDVEVPATLVVDGQKYPNVGIHFRGMSSYGMVGAGSKRSLNISMDLVDEEQRLYGYKTLNLLNSHEDETFLHTVLYSHIARQHIPAPKANFVKVVINGESWGIYVNAQQFDKTFLKENYKSPKGTRWKVRGSPGGGGGLEYVGDKVEDYKRRYQIKSDDSDKAWRALVALCRTLKETPPEQLEAALEPMLDIDNVLWFLALDNALINSDGYWIRASDYAIFRDRDGKFHFIPHDMNEAFQPPSGPGAGGPGRGGPGRGRPGRGGPDGVEPRPGDVAGDRAERGAPAEGLAAREPAAEPPDRGGPPRGEPGRGGRGGTGYALDPLVGLNDPSKPLRSRLLAVPALRAKYLAHVRTIANDSLDWQKLGPIVAQYESLIGKEIEADTRKLSSYTAFQRALADGTTSEPGASNNVNLFRFAHERRKFLLEYPDPNAAR